MKLTAKQKAFCEEYIIDLNATQAAIRAGYSKKTSTVTACENLTKPNIQEYISLLKGNREERTKITQDMVVKELAKVAFGDIKNIFDDNDNLLPIHKLDNSTSATLSSIKVRRERGQDGQESLDTIEEYKTYDKMKALDMLGRHLGIFEKDNSQKPTNTTEIIGYEVKVIE